MLKIKRISEVIGKKVYNDDGELIGFVEELNILDNKVDGWRIIVSRDSKISQLMGGARGLIVPQNFIKSAGNIILISKEAVPIKEENVSLEEEIESSDVERLD